MRELYVIGTGPGDHRHMTPAAEEAIRRADLVCGYTFYVDLVKDRFPGKEYYATGMTSEIERCRYAVEQAAEGKTVALICSGDAGVYGLAEPALALAEGTDVTVHVVPGITAAQSGAAVLGAPLTNDYCVISLSDHLTPWDVIETRLRNAAEGDFVIVLYNPCSRKRPDHLRRACDILLRVKEPSTVCGWVRNIGRDGQESEILTLGELRDKTLDMFCTVFVGNTATKALSGNMVTARGYQI